VNVDLVLVITAIEVSTRHNVKISENYYVWAAPTLLSVGPLHNTALNSLRGANAIGVLNLAGVNAKKVWHDLNSLLSFTKKISNIIEYRNTRM
jgi:hypothetical protein